jgi:hypothetical protein
MGGASVSLQWKFDFTTPPASPLRLTCTDVPANWTSKDTLRFWVYRPTATGDLTLSVWLGSPSTWEGTTSQGFRAKVVLKAGVSGWSEVSLPYFAFTPLPAPTLIGNVEPKSWTVGPNGWNQVQCLQIVADGAKNPTSTSTAAHSKALNLIFTRFHLVRGNALDDVNYANKGTLLDPAAEGWAGAIRVLATDPAAQTLKAARGAVQWVSGVSKVTWQQPASQPTWLVPARIIASSGVRAQEPVLRCWVYNNGSAPASLTVTAISELSATDRVTTSATWTLSPPTEKEPSPGRFWSEYWLRLAEIPSGRPLTRLEFTSGGTAPAGTVVFDNLRVGLESGRVLDLSEKLSERPSGLGENYEWSHQPLTETVKIFIKNTNNDSSAAKALTADETMWMAYRRNTSTPPVTRDAYERPFGERTGLVVNAVIASCASPGNEPLLKWAKKVIQRVLNEPVWHVPSEALSDDDYRLGTELISLTSAARSWSMATADRLMGDKLPETDRASLRWKTQRIIFNPYGYHLRTNIGRGMWFREGEGNVNEVLTGGVVGSGLALLESRLQRATLIEAGEVSDTFYFKGLTSVGYNSDGFMSDGYYSEGVTYWDYGFGHFVLRSEAVRMATGNFANYLDPTAANLKVQVAASFPRRYEMNPGLYPAFADAGLDAKPRVWLRQFLAVNYRTPPPTITPLYNEYNQVLGAQFHQIAYWISNTPVFTGLGTPGTLPLRDEFPAAQTYVLRSTTPNGLAVAFRGGGNNEGPHEHSDVGTYSIGAANSTLSVALVGDPGAGAYDQDNFGANRYNSSFNNSAGHPVPVVDGNLQTAYPSSAPEVVYNTLKAESLPFPPTFGLRENPRFTTNQDMVLLNLKKFYLKTGGLTDSDIQRLTRRFVFDRSANSSLTIEDRVEFNPGGPLRNFSVPVIRPYLLGDATYNYTKLADLGDFKAFLVARSGFKLLVTITGSGWNGLTDVPFKYIEVNNLETPANNKTTIGHINTGFQSGVLSATIITRFEMVTKDPILLPIPGTTQLRVVTTTPNGTIYYTTNGATPTNGSTSAFVLSGAKVLASASTPFKAATAFDASGTATTGKISSFNFGAAYANWRKSKWETTVINSKTTALADPDKDGLNNALEYAFDTPPNAVQSQPAVTVGTTADQRFLTLTFPVRAEPTLTYTVEGNSIDPGASSPHWQVVNSFPGSSYDAGPVVVTDTVPISAQPRRFLRVRVTGPDMP